LIPEFFFQPEFLVNANEFDLGHVNHVALPQWATNPHEFVYLHRKALESEYVSQHLHHWIDLMWGYLQRGEAAHEHMNSFDPMLYDTVWTTHGLGPDMTRAIETQLDQCGHVPPQLFTKPHPRRILTKKSTRLAAEFDVKIDCAKVVFALIRPTKLVVLADTGHFHLLTVVKGSKPTIRVVASIDPRAALAFAEIDENRIAIASAVGLVNIIDIRTGALRGLLGHVGTVNCVAADDRNIVSGGADTILQCWLLSDLALPPQRIPSFGGEISCVTMSKTFDMYVGGSVDGAIFIVSTRTGDVSRVISLQNNGIARRMLITKEWGFILAYITEMVDGRLSHNLFTFSVNGDLIRKVAIDAAVVAWTDWISPDGFDYVLVADERNRLFELEVFFLSQVRDPVDLESRVESVFYSPDEDLVITVATNGTVRFRSKHRKHRLSDLSP
jgi:WD40 repeat protein